MSIVTEEMVLKASRVLRTTISMRAALEAVAEDLVKAEREACAKIADSYADFYGNGAWWIVIDIRERGE